MNTKTGSSWMRSTTWLCCGPSSPGTTRDASAALWMRTLYSRPNRTGNSTAGSRQSWTGSKRSITGSRTIQKTNALRTMRRLRKSWRKRMHCHTGSGPAASFWPMGSRKTTKGSRLSNSMILGRLQRCPSARIPAIASASIQSRSRNPFGTISRCRKTSLIRCLHAQNSMSLLRKT